MAAAFHATTTGQRSRIVALSDIQGDITIPVELRRQDGGPIRAMVHTQRGDLAHLSPRELLRELCTPPEGPTNPPQQREVHPIDSDEPGPGMPGQGRPFDFLRQFMHTGEVVLPAQPPAAADPLPHLAEANEVADIPQRLAAHVDGVFYEFAGEGQFFEANDAIVHELEERQVALNEGIENFHIENAALTAENEALDARQRAAVTRLQEQDEALERRAKNWRRAENAALFLPRVVGSLVTTPFTVFTPDVMIATQKWIWNIENQNQIDKE